jgi:hypothetical protein
MKQTAVDWLVETITKKHDKHFSTFYGAEIEQAKEMEKEQMDKVAGDFWNEGASYMYDGKREFESFEQYYKETFGK